MRTFPYLSMVMGLMFCFDLAGSTPSAIFAAVTHLSASLAVPILWDSEYQTGKLTQNIALLTLLDPV